METAELKKTIEALLFVSGKGISKKKIAEITEMPQEKISETVNALKQEWNSNHGVFIEEIGGGYQISTRPEYSPAILKLYPWKGVMRLSSSAAEVLSIVLYKQPVTTSEINEIRGVDSTGVIATLLKNNLIKYSGRKDAPGNPRLIRINEPFYHIFGIRDVSDIPSWRELGGGGEEENERGESSRGEEISEEPGTDDLSEGEEDGEDSEI
ncbi:MAG: SMC-Scp complex subunit ScpB [Elusimicrobia bacterium CG03_land_8_20_14_0_80_50_18]|nr:MAG: SMC-Scp complex subunit ScpB [Elusimicrobia bacterium CG03_land_8_20_14_0_80_50_18]PIX15858.1 MAG: SMC-Scp complex subunit ScpB [Elusimicrobia bacterium CG_4_8_14_3_um_filter_50_9]